MFREIRNAERINETVDREREKLQERLIDALIGTQAHYNAVMALREYDLSHGIVSVFSAEDFVAPPVLF